MYGRLATDPNRMHFQLDTSHLQERQKPLQPKGSTANSSGIVISCEAHFHIVSSIFQFLESGSTRERSGAMNPRRRPEKRVCKKTCSTPCSSEVYHVSLFDSGQS